MKIYNYDKKTKIFLGESNAQENPKKMGEFLFPPNSTILIPPLLKENEVAVFNGDFWNIVSDFRKMKQINLETKEISEVTEVGDLETGYMLYSEYKNTVEYKKNLEEEKFQEELFEIQSQISEIDLKRIRAICEPQVKDELSGETWLEFYNNQIIELRKKYQEVKYGA